MQHVIGGHEEMCQRSVEQQNTGVRLITKLIPSVKHKSYDRGL